MTNSRLALFPKTTAISQNRLEIGGCDIAELASAFGTPLYLYDQSTMDSAVHEYRRALERYYPGDSAITYAGKAFLCTAVAQWSQQAGLWLDCTGAGELHIAAKANVPRDSILVHGVNKSIGDLKAAIASAGTIVIDNLAELHTLLTLVGKESSGAENDIQPDTEAGTECVYPDTLPQLWLRIRPGIAVETHSYTQTGQEDSKFGMSLADGIEAIRLAQRHQLSVPGLHFHQGSHFHNPEPIGPALETILDLLVEIRAQTGWFPQTLCPGGGWGVPYHEDDLPHPTIDAYVQFVAEALVAGCQQRQLPLPTLHLEPGRSIVATAGVAIYTVGAVKQTQNRRWLMIDGGLADNPRPALYQARYSALPVVDPSRPYSGDATFAGPFCESGDILIHDLEMADIAAGEVVAVPVSGAYQLSMGSNYNGAVKPAVLWLNNGEACLIQRRQELADLTALDLPLVLDS